MVRVDINRVFMTGSLTSEPELRTLPSGRSVCRFQIACQPAFSMREERPSHFDVAVWESEGEDVARYLEKGSTVALDGHLESREWEDAGGEKQQSVEIVAGSIQFMSTPSSPSKARAKELAPQEEATAKVSIPVLPREPAPDDSDIPF